MPSRPTSRQADYPRSRASTLQSAKVLQKLKRRVDEAVGCEPENAADAGRGICTGSSHQDDLAVRLHSHVAREREAGRCSGCNPTRTERRVDRSISVKLHHLGGGKAGADSGKESDVGGNQDFAAGSDGNRLSRDVGNDAQRIWKDDLLLAGLVEAGVKGSRRGQPDDRNRAVTKGGGCPADDTRRDDLAVGLNRHRVEITVGTGNGKLAAGAEGWVETTIGRQAGDKASAGGIGSRDGIINGRRQGWCPALVDRRSR